MSAIPVEAVNRIKKKFQQRRDFVAVGTPARKLKKRLANLAHIEATEILTLTHPNIAFKTIGGVTIVTRPRKPMPNGCHISKVNCYGHLSQHTSRVGKRVKIGPQQKLEKLPKLTPKQVDQLELAMETQIKGITGSLTVEGSAIHHNVHPKHIQEVFRRLNRKGLLGQKTRAFAHDTNRNGMFYGSDSGWAANYYTILTP